MYDYDTDMEYEIAEVILHEKYGDETGSNLDFCLLKTAEAINFDTPGAGIVCLPGEDQHVAAGAENCFVGGWGVIGTGGADPTVAQSVGVTIYSEEECLQSNYDPEDIDAVFYRTPPLL